MKTIKYTLICLVAFLLWNGMVKGQSDSINKAAKSSSASSDKEILLLEKKYNGVTYKYNKIVKGKYLKCSLNNLVDNRKLKKIKGRLTKIDTSFMVINKTIVYYNQISRISMWTTPKIIVKAFSVPIILAGAIGGAIGIVFGATSGALLIPAGIAIGVALLVIPVHKYDFSVWTCSKSTNKIFKQKKRNLKK